MSWIYRRNPVAPAPAMPTPFPTNAESAPDLYEVGWLMPDGTFIVVRTQTTERDAARVVHYLAGGDPDDWPPHD